MTGTEESQPEDLYVKVPHALLELVEKRVIKPADAWLYVVLLKHINTDRAKRGDTHVWPSRPTIAAGMGLARKSVDKVDKYVDRLVEKKLVRKTRRTRNGTFVSNLYKLEKPSSVPTHQTAGTPQAETIAEDVSAARGIPTVQGGPTHQTGATLPTERQPELEEVELPEREDQNLNPPTPRAVPAEPATEPVEVVEDRGGVLSDAGEGGSDGVGERVPAQRDGDPTERRAQRAEERRLAWQAVASRGKDLSNTARASLASQLMRSLRAGWTYAELTELLDQPLPEVPHDLAAVFIARLRNIGDPPPPPDPTDLIPCPIEGHFAYQDRRQYPALKCVDCRIAARAGRDPFEGRYDRRHPDWEETYGFFPIPEPVEELTPEEWAQFERIKNSLPEADEDAPTADTRSAVGAGEVNPW